MTAKDAMRIRNDPMAEDEVFELKELHKCIDEALEKQIPKKPKERHSIKWGDSYNDGECPNCGAAYSDSLLDTPLYCSQCGQILDWGDDNA